MKTLIIIIFYILSYNCFGQEVETIEELKLADSTLIKDKSDIIILRKDIKFQVVTSRKKLISTCEICSSYGRDYKTLFEILKKNKTKEINYNELRIQNLEDAFETIYEDLLLSNECVVYNISRKKIEKKVFVTMYDPDSENFGLEYKTENGIVILKTVNFQGI